MRDNDAAGIAAAESWLQREREEYEEWRVRMLPSLYATFHARLAERRASSNLPYLLPGVKVINISLPEGFCWNSFNPKIAGGLREVAADLEWHQKDRCTLWPNSKPNSSQDAANVDSEPLQKQKSESNEQTAKASSAVMNESDAVARDRRAYELGMDIRLTWTQIQSTLNQEFEGKQVVPWDCRSGNSAHAAAKRHLVSHPKLPALPERPRGRKKHCEK
jgi:hypothetical protein